MRNARAWVLSAVLLATAAAPSFAQGFGGRGFGNFGGDGASLLRITEVQQELKIDAAQKDLLDQLSMETRQKFQGLQGLSNEERGAKFRSIQQESQKQINAILNPAQQKRLKELEVQQGGPRSLLRADVQAALKLTDDQKAKLAAAQTEEREAMRSLFQGGFQNATPEQRQKVADARNGASAKMLGVLTEAQKKQFTEMQGAPFKFPERRRGGERRQRGQNNGNA